MRATQISARRFAANHPADTAQLLEQYAPAEAGDFLNELPPATAAAVLSQMSEPHGAACLAAMEPKRASAAAGGVAPSSLAALLRRLPAEQHQALLAAASPDLRQQVQRLLTFAEGTVGAACDPDVVTMTGSLSVSEAKRRLRRHPGAFHHQVYVVSEGRQLTGVLHMRELMRADAKSTIASMMQPATVRLPATVKLASTHSLPAWNRMDAIPVVDDSGILVGVLRHRQVRSLLSTPGAGGLVGALLGLGELYWVGLTTFLPVAVAANVRKGTTEPSKGDDHGR